MLAATQQILKSLLVLRARERVQFTLLLLYLSQSLHGSFNTFLKLLTIQLSCRVKQQHIYKYIEHKTVLNDTYHPTQLIPLVLDLFFFFFTVSPYLTFILRK